MTKIRQDEGNYYILDVVKDFVFKWAIK